jgi:hypothetical protein
VKPAAITDVTTGSSSAPVGSVGVGVGEAAVALRLGVVAGAELAGAAPPPSSEQATSAERASTVVAAIVVERTDFTFLGGTADISWYEVIPRPVPDDGQIAPKSYCGHAGRVRRCESTAAWTGVFA